MRRRGAELLILVVTLGVAVPARAISTEERLRQLETLLRQQQREIEQLRIELKQQKAIGTATQQQAERAEEQAKATEKKATASLPEWVNKFTPFGDLRIRHEGFYDQQVPKSGGKPVHARNRERYRWRLGLKYAYSEELGMTARLASGNPDDPISTNQTFGDEWTPKNVNLNWAYLTVAPGKSFGIRPGLITTNSGKFPNPMFRVDEMVFDDDLAPEGFNQTIAFLDKPVGALDQVNLHLQEWNFQEVSNSHDGWMFGGQINPTAHVGDVVLQGGLGQYYWLHPDLIAQASNTNSVLVLSNLVNTETEDGDETITGFQSGFNQTNVTISATIPNAAGSSMPLQFFGDYVHNFQAVNDHNDGVAGGVRLGKPKEPGDWAASLMYEWLEREAAVGDFVWSDFNNGGTNVMGPVIRLEYQLFKPLTLAAQSFFTQLIDPPDTLDNRTQVRLQLDAQLKF